MIAVESLTYKCYGSGTERIYLLYDGIHYDCISKNYSEEAPAETDITRFDISDSLSLEGSLFIGLDLKKA